MCISTALHNVNLDSGCVLHNCLQVTMGHAEWAKQFLAVSRACRAFCKHVLYRFQDSNLRRASGFTLPMRQLPAEHQPVRRRTGGKEELACI